MAESETVIGGRTLAGGEVGGSARAMVGGSLPPRKRLLAGLKQNGSWPAASSQSSPSTPEIIIHGPQEGASEEVGKVEVSPSSTAILTEAKGSCMSCGALESNTWKRVKRNGAVHRVCSSCAFLLNKNASCLHSQATCPDVKDSSVHLECQQRSSLSSRVDSDSSILPNCSQVNIQNEIGIAPHRTSTGIVGKNCHLGSGNCASSAATESLSPRNKKPRVSKEPRSESSWKVAGDVDIVERMSQDSKAVVERRRPTSQEIAVAAAEEVAALAGMAAAKAKATAAVKAAAAIKAAAVAKAALDAAALAARADAQVRAELCRSSWFSDCIGGGGGLQRDVAQVETRKERVEKQDVKIKGEEILGATQSSIGDEELARELHRVINSSPRISRGLAPLRRKSAGQPGAVCIASDSVRVIPRSVVSSPAEPRPQLKQQQTRSRSMSQKDVKRLGPKFGKQESQTAETHGCQNSLEQAVYLTASDGAGQLVALKSEAAISSTVTLLKEESGSGQRQSMTIASPEILMKTETGQMSYITQRACDVSEGNDIVLPASAVSEAAAMLDEVLISEASAEKPTKEGCHSRSRVGMSPAHVEEEFHPSSSSILPVSKSAARELEGTEGLRIIERDLVLDATLAEVACSGVDILDPLAISSKGYSAEARVVVHNDGKELDPDPESALIVSIPRSLSDEFTLKNLKNSSELEDSPSESLSHSGASHGKPWQRGNVKGVPGGGQGFGSGVHISSLSSASPILIRTPSLASRSTN